MPPLTKQIKGTDKNNKTAFQIFVIVPFFQNIQIYHALIVSCSLGNVSIPRGLHFNIVHSPFAILHINIQTHAFCICGNIYCLLRFRIFNAGYFYAKHQFQKGLAKLRVPHDNTKHEIVLYLQFLKSFFHSVSAFLWFDYNISAQPDKGLFCI